MAIQITNMSKEFTDVEKYLMTTAQSIISMKDVADGTKITVAGTLEFTDTKDGKDPVQITSIITPDNTVYSCQSMTFKRSLQDIENIMNGKEFTIIKISGTTKAGRPYINCVLDVEALNNANKK